MGINFLNKCLFAMICVILTACSEHGKTTNANHLSKTDVIEKDTLAKQDVRVQPKDTIPEIHYQIISKPDWVDLSDTGFVGAKHLDILIAINRTDSVHLKRMDSLVVPQRYDLPVDAYMPFPKEVEILKDISKIIIFSNPIQAFAAYENGVLVQQGQTNTGRETHPTPPKLYFTNWKAKQSRSTVNSSWILNWNFNISNFGGIGFHQYALPGYPASHSCLRLLNHQAYFLYNWADQWILKNDQLVANGTPVIVYGRYRFDEPAPWLKLVENPNILRYNQDSMKAIVQPYLEEILESQQKREVYLKKTSEQLNL